MQKTKHRIETLDDWKIMCEQLKRDRSRLEDEVDALKTERVRLVSELAKTRERAIEERHHLDGNDGAVASPSSTTAAAVSSLMEHGDLRLELERLKRHADNLEREKRISEAELKRLRRDVHDVLIGHDKGSGGMSLIYSIVQGFWGVKERSYHSPYPVMQV